jgi:hypothetical protein
LVVVIGTRKIMPRGWKVGSQEAGKPGGGEAKTQSAERTERLGVGKNEGKGMAGKPPDSKAEDGYHRVNP